MTGKCLFYETQNPASRISPGRKTKGIAEPRLPREFFLRDGLTVARELLGKVLVHRTSHGIIRGIITEVEAYMGETDKGSHTYGGRRTERTEPMYHIGGTSYVYLIYGMYSCMNVACMAEGIPQAVLLRSVIPADEASRLLMTQLRLELLNDRQARKMQRLRLEENNAGQAGRSQGLQQKAAENAAEDVCQQQGEKPLYTVGNLPAAVKKHLADGPGKLCIAMGISRADNDLDMVESPDFYITEGTAISPEQIQAAKRIGIDYAEEAADYLWRFYVTTIQNYEK